MIRPNTTAQASDELATAFADLPDALRAHPGVKRLYRAAVSVLGAKEDAERARRAHGVNASDALKVEWDGSCVLGHCGSPSGCERDDRCRADPTHGLKETP